MRLSTVLGWDTTSDSMNPRKPVVGACEGDGFDVGHHNSFYEVGCRLSEVGLPSWPRYRATDMTKVQRAAVYPSGGAGRAWCAAANRNVSGGTRGRCRRCPQRWRPVLLRRRP